MSINTLTPAAGDVVIGLTGSVYGLRAVIEKYREEEREVDFTFNANALLYPDNRVSCGGGPSVSFEPVSSLEATDILLDQSFRRVNCNAGGRNELTLKKRVWLFKPATTSIVYLNIKTPSYQSYIDRRKRLNDQLSRVRAKTSELASGVTGGFILKRGNYTIMKESGSSFGRKPDDYRAAMVLNHLQRGIKMMITWKKESDTGYIAFISSGGFGSGAFRTHEEFNQFVEAYGLTVCSEKGPYGQMVLIPSELDNWMPLTLEQVD